MKLIHHERPDEYVIITKARCWRFLRFTESEHTYPITDRELYLQRLRVCGWRKAHTGIQ